MPAAISRDLVRAVTVQLGLDPATVHSILIEPGQVVVEKYVTQQGRKVHGPDGEPLYQKHYFSVVNDWMDW